ncbi:hypothetical protein PIB30_047941 [Stylosanthes scabra]|uniref:Uncharacterized protein n=1 Tax=Stylosanthes scabra TaxID=79078 RepID=A0ABU6WFA4_9FABA|nr:hypothetical protein [Stylosanthes scabra]
MFSDLNNGLPIQPRRLFHSNVTHGTTISTNRRERAKGGTVLPLVINLVALMMTSVFRHRSKDFDPICWFMLEHFTRYALSDKYKPAEVALDFFRAYMSRKVKQLIRVSDSIRMRLALDLVLKEYNDLSPIIEMNATKFKSMVEEVHEDIRE